MATGIILTVDQIRSIISDMASNKGMELEELLDQKVNAVSTQVQKQLIIKCEKKSSEIDTLNELMKKLSPNA